jgi:methylated-DNA-protein-cysteine methyltransferase-like protein
VKRLARTFERMLAVVRTIPRGRVLTYGEVARRAGFPRGARVAGYALHGAKGSVPWQRVIGQRRAGVGQISIRDPIGAAVQRQMLEKEGVKFSPSGGIDLARFGHGRGRLRTPYRRARS